MLTLFILAKIPPSSEAPIHVQGLSKALDVSHRAPCLQPGQGGQVQAPLRAAVGLGGVASGQCLPVHSLPYLECSWLRTVGRKKRELRDEKSHVTVTSEAKEENITGERGQGRREFALLLSQGPGTWESSLGNAVWTSPCASGEGSGLDVGTPGVRL